MELLPNDRDLLVKEQEMIEDRIDKLASRIYISEGFNEELDRILFRRLLSAMEEYRSAVLNILTSI